MASDLRQLLSAVKHCHGTGLVHNDLKFDNIMCHSCVSVSHFLKVLFDMENQKEKEYGMGSKFQSAYTVSILLRTNSPWIPRVLVKGVCVFGFTWLGSLVFRQTWIGEVVEVVIWCSPKVEADWLWQCPVFNQQSTCCCSAPTAAMAWKSSFDWQHPGFESGLKAVGRWFFPGAG